MARIIWVDVVEREGELGKEDLLRKMYAFFFSFFFFWDYVVEYLSNLLAGPL